MPPIKLDIENELNRNEFRVSIFGSARVKPDDPIYDETYNLAKFLGGMGVDLITGGGPGLMEAAALGHLAGDIKNVAHNIGLNIVLPFEQKPNLNLEYLENHERFSTRLDEFMLLSNAVAVMPGGIGSCLELFYTWQLLQVKHVTKMPLILVGKMWRKLIDWVIDYPLHDHYLSTEDFHYVVVVDNWKQAAKVIKEAKRRFDHGNGHIEPPWHLYGRKMKKLSNLF